MASKRRKTWQEKLADDKGLPRVAEIEGKLRKRWGEGTVVIPAPRQVDEAMKSIRKGKLTTIAHLREALATSAGATMACPITTGIFAWIAAHAAAEAESEGRRRITPYWRTLKTGGEINLKYPGGIIESRRRLEAEGHVVVQRGKKWFVVDYERVAVAPR
ncbi:MAG: MGMT family protein [Planctomycetales bacterium]|nr:MGMT family protein [Planctomycetales bacterium]